MTTFYSNTQRVIRHYIASACGDLLYGVCGVTGATTSKIYAPFLWQANDYYNNLKYEVYVYLGTNKGDTKRVTDWVLADLLLTVHSVYGAACDATSYIELHKNFSTDEYNKAINLAIEHLGRNYLLNIKDETTTLVASKYEYEVPSSMLYIVQITTEDTADSGDFFNEDIVDPRDYSIVPSDPPKLKLDKRHYSVTAGLDLRIEGQTAQQTVDSDTDIIYLPSDWIVQKAITFLPVSKIMTNRMEATYKAAVEYAKDEPRSYPHAFAKKVDD